MHKLLAGIMGIFMGFTSFFHSGQATPPNTNTQQAMISGTPAQHEGMRQGNYRKMKLPTGEKPFFGTVTAVNGSTLTLQTQIRMMGRRNASITPSVTLPQTLTITLDSTTTYKGGSQSDITTNTKIAGIGKTNSDGSLTAVTVQINPTLPSGFPMRNRNRNRNPQNSQ